MSVEDLTLDCQSDQEDHSAEKKARDLRLVQEADGHVVVGGVGSVGTGGEDDILYLELFLLFDNLKSFERIYDNNALIDLEFEIRNRRGNQHRTSERMSNSDEVNDTENVEVEDGNNEEGHDDNEEGSEDDYIEEQDDSEGLDES